MFWRGTCSWWIGCEKIWIHSYIFRFHQHSEIKCGSYFKSNYKVWNPKCFIKIGRVYFFRNFRTIKQTVTDFASFIVVEIYGSFFFYFLLYLYIFMYIYFHLLFPLLYLILTCIPFSPLFSTNTFPLQSWSLTFNFFHVYVKGNTVSRCCSCLQLKKGLHRPWKQFCGIYIHLWHLLAMNLYFSNYLFILFSIRFIICWFWQLVICPYICI